MIDKELNEKSFTINQEQAKKISRLSQSEIDSIHEEAKRTNTPVEEKTSNPAQPAIDQLDIVY